MTMFDKYSKRKSIHVMLQNFERYLKREINDSKSFEKIFYLIWYQPSLALGIVYHDDITMLNAVSLKILVCLSFFFYFRLTVSFI